MAKKANSTPGCAASRLREEIMPLYSPLVRHIWSAGSDPGLPSPRQGWTYWSESSTG